MISVVLVAHRIFYAALGGIVGAKCFVELSTQCLPSAYSPHGSSISYFGAKSKIIFRIGTSMQ